MKIYQIMLSAQAAYGRGRLDAWRQMLMGADNWKPEYLKLYTHVADVATEEPEEAYRLMNLWGEPERVTARMRSVRSLSVGDIVELASGHRLIVDTCGFAELPEAGDPPTCTLEDGTETYL